MEDRAAVQERAEISRGRQSGSVRATPETETASALYEGKSEVVPLGRYGLKILHSVCIH